MFQQTDTQQRIVRESKLNQRNENLSKLWRPVRISASCFVIPSRNLLFLLGRIITTAAIWSNSIQQHLSPHEGPLGNIPTICLFVLWHARTEVDHSLLLQQEFVLQPIPVPEVFLWNIQYKARRLLVFSSWAFPPIYVYFRSPSKSNRDRNLFYAFLFELANSLCSGIIIKSVEQKRLLRCSEIGFKSARPSPATCSPF